MGNAPFVSRLESYPQLWGWFLESFVVVPLFELNGYNSLTPFFLSKGVNRVKAS